MTTATRKVDPTIPTYHKVPEERKYMFRLLRGRHNQKEWDEASESWKSHTFHNAEAGNNIVYNDIDLSVKHGSEKFQKLAGPDMAKIVPEDDRVEPAKITRDQLERMNKEKLAGYAAAEEIDLEGCETKAEMVERIVASTPGI